MKLSRTFVLSGSLTVFLLGAAAVSRGGAADSKPETTPVASQPTPAVQPTPAISADEAKLTPTQAKSYLLRGATVITLSKQGTLSPGDILIQDGKIAAVGASLQAPAGAVVLELNGQFVTPGLIDAHSHSGVRGDVNECTDAVTSEVRVADILDPTEISLYRELAGGLTVANVLHGSCNPIGGQNAVIKLRYGAANPEDLLFAGAPPGIKFALGENVKQSNWDDQSKARYPRSRMGVVEVMRDAFRRAKTYREEWNRYAEAQRSGDRTAMPPRRDLELDALVEVLEGKRLVHCHSYRADEILATMRVAEEFGFKIATFQHGLEAYRVADEIAAHGAGVSMFSDWWAYKMEVYDAIPYNAAICWQRGVLVSLNSDSDELARRLNLEAAKAVKYGGVPDEEALKMVTLNPAIQLGISKWVGSIEPGKDGDLAIWSHHPLSSRTICLMTFIDGRIYFDRARDLVERKKRADEKKSLQDLEKQAADKEKEEAKKDEAKKKEEEAKGTPSPNESPSPASSPAAATPLATPAPASEVSPSQPAPSPTPLAVDSGPPESTPVAAPQRGRKQTRARKRQRALQRAGSGQSRAEASASTPSTLTSAPVPTSSDNAGGRP